MAALAIAASCACGTIKARAGEAPVENKVNLQLQITGLGAEGCTLEIKPGHPGCQFESLERRVKRVGETVTLAPIAITAKSTGADRDCSFAITIKEPGQPPKTFRRGLRLSARAAGEPAPVQSLKVYLSAPSVAIRDSGSSPRR
jgi:hypothetical protein